MPYLDERQVNDETMCELATTNPPVERQLLHGISKRETALKVPMQLVAATVELQPKTRRCITCLVSFLNEGAQQQEHICTCPTTYIPF